LAILESEIFVESRRFAAIRGAAAYEAFDPESAVLKSQSRVCACSPRPGGEERGLIFRCGGFDGNPLSPLKKTDLPPDLALIHEIRSRQETAIDRP
jgi:hypothetical protein